MNRRSGTNHDDNDEENHTMYGMSLQWVSLLFAAFASGAQFTTLPKKERDLVSQVYGMSPVRQTSPPKSLLTGTSVLLI